MKKVYTFVGTIKELKERLAERVEKEENLFDYFQKWEKKYDKLTEDYLRDIKEINRRFVSDKKFNWEKVDYDFSLEKDREAYDNERAEAEENL